MLSDVLLRDFGSTTVFDSECYFVGERNFLTLQKGDLIVLENETGESVLNSSWCKGTCERTGKTGDFPTETVYVIPTLDKPTSEIMVCLKII